MLLDAMTPNVKIFIKQRHQAVSDSIFSFLMKGIESDEFQPTEPLESATLTIMSFLDSIFFESLINGANRMGMEAQLKTMRSMLALVINPIRS